ncbi:hypothetical protein EXIGLDRAFT_776091 [Exidia glandulosa HHB12029]|uniref:F-box domain-containing protein n=1 Tax=Exidia glandulosa HHB12029 TaxID=1314781 RepID=A0A165ZQA7_EXIGL|nr:hypothetical protein EXIGLDRAFT_776091 [Exidia glandulosa HHB12029]
MPPAAIDAAGRRNPKMQPTAACLKPDCWPTSTDLLDLASLGPRLSIVTTLHLTIDNTKSRIRATLRLCSACSSLHDLTVLLYGSYKYTANDDSLDSEADYALSKSTCTLLPSVLRLFVKSRFWTPIILFLLSNVPNLEDLTLHVHRDLGTVINSGTDFAWATWKLRRLSFRRCDHSLIAHVLHSSRNSLRELEFNPSLVPSELLQVLVVAAQNLRTIVATSPHLQVFLPDLAPSLSASRRLTTLSISYQELHNITGVLAALIPSRMRHLVLDGSCAPEEANTAAFVHFAEELSSHASAITSLRLQRLTFIVFIVAVPGSKAFRALEAACQSRRIALTVEWNND